MLRLAKLGPGGVARAAGRDDQTMLLLQMGILAGGSQAGKGFNSVKSRIILKLFF